MLLVLDDMLLLGRIAAHLILPVSSGSVELIVNVEKTLVALLKTPRVVVFIVYRGLFTSCPLIYHLTVGVGLASNWQLQLALVFMNTIVAFGRVRPKVGATNEKFEIINDIKKPFREYQLILCLKFTSLCIVAPCFKQCFLCGHVIEIKDKPDLVKIGSSLQLY